MRKLFKGLGWTLLILFMVACVSSLLYLTIPEVAAWFNKVFPFIQNIKIGG